MKKSKKFIIIALLGVVLLAGTIGGVVYGQTSTDQNQAQTAFSAMLDKVAAIYKQNTGVTIDAQELQKAMEQAGSELRSQAMQQRLQAMVDQGKITQQQADDYQTWLNAKPDFPAKPGFGGFGGRFGGMRGFCFPQQRATTN